MGLLVALGLASPASALICSSIPYVFSNGTTADATQINANFSAFQACVNVNAATAGANSNITSLTGLVSILVSANGSFGSILSSGDITMTGTGQLILAAGTTAQRSGSPLSGMIRFNTTLSSYEGYNAATTSWGPLASAVPVTPQGRLTLTSATPVLTGAVTGATAVLYTPYQGNQFPVWNGVSFVSQAFTEFSQALSDTTLSPAAAVAASVYDIFGWYNSNTSTMTFSRGPAWTNTTTRGYSLSRVQGVLVNASTIFNGPAAGYGVYVGTIATDAGGATVTWNRGSAASGGGAATLNIWNMYNRLTVGAQVVDSRATYTYGSATPRQARASTGNQVNFVLGQVEDAISAHYQNNWKAASAFGSVYNGLGLDSTSAYSSGLSVVIQAFTANAVGADVLSAVFSPAVGTLYIAALEATDGTYTFTFDNSANNALTAQLRM